MVVEKNYAMHNKSAKEDAGPVDVFIYELNRNSDCKQVYVGLKN